MKRFAAGLLIAICCLSVFSQGLDGIIVEEIPVDSVIASTDSALSLHATVYRIFIDMDLSRELQFVYGAFAHELIFETSSTFYNTGHYGKTLAQEIDTSLFSTVPALFYDSWITINAASSTDLGILRSEDDNNDGYFPDTAYATTIFGEDFDNAFDTVNYTGKFSTLTGSYGVDSSEKGPTDENHVLIGQFTTDGDFSFELNLEIKDTATQNIEQYVAHNPTGNEIHFPQLKYPYIPGCTSSTACNYDSLATVDDGSCIESIDPCYPCAGDTIALLDADSNNVCDLDQPGLEDIVLETYYIADAADHVLDSNLSAGSVTYRIFIDMAPGFQLSTVFGVDNQELLIETTTSFFNHPDGSALANDIDTSLFHDYPTLVLDSWISAGNSTGAYHDGILKSSDIDGSIVTELTNSVPEVGIPLTISDGLIPGTEKDMHTTQLELSVFKHAGGSGFMVNEGGWSASGGSVGPTADNRVLLGQFTTNGYLSFELNVILESPTGSTVYYVSKNPGSWQIQSDLLTYYPDIPGCTSPSACNYNALATFDDGSCLEPVENCYECSGDSLMIIDSDSDGVCNAEEVLGCTSPTACNYDSLATEDNGSCLEPVENCYECSGDSLVIIDSDGDGVCNAEEVMGCTSITACNYNSLATEDDGSCLEPVENCYECSGDSLVMIDSDGDGVCDADEVLGCTSPTACNFDLLATEDNGSCLEPVENCYECSGDSLVIVDSDGDDICDAEEVMGCTSLTACNYDSLATEDDGSCLEPVENCYECSGDSLVIVDSDGDGVCDSEEVPGCTSITACNYNSLATEDDGSCLEPIENCYECSGNTLQIIDSDGDFKCDAEDPNPYQLPYEVQPIESSCITDDICIPLMAVDPVGNITGYDFTMVYDTSKVSPAGIVNLSNDMINAGYVDYFYSVDNANGLVNISLEVNSLAPANTCFEGLGEICCVGFTQKSNLDYGDTILFSVPSIIEILASGSQPSAVEYGYFTATLNTIHRGRLMYWSGYAPIVYDTLNKSDYLVTNIYGNNNNCDERSPDAVQPDLKGYFRYQSSQGQYIEIERDIAPSTDVMTVINSYDALLTARLLTNDSLFVPNVYQIIAMDVNKDGWVSAGDLSQMNLRTVAAIDEFRQAWNYDSQGISNGIPSKDWIFIDQGTLFDEPQFKISSYYPANDGNGYSKWNVPVIEHCVSIPEFYNCAVPDENYIGILYGDVDGNYKNISHDGLLKSRADNNSDVVIDLIEANFKNDRVEIPVYVVSAEPVVSLDIDLAIDQENFTYDTLVCYVDYLDFFQAHYNKHNNILKVTAGTRKEMTNGQKIISLNLKTKNYQFHPNGLKPRYALVNGREAEIIIRNNIENVDENAGINRLSVRIYPNPASEFLHVVPTQDARIELFGVEGKIFRDKAIYKNTINELNVNELNNGTYILKIMGEHTVIIHKVMIIK